MNFSDSKYNFKKKFYSSIRRKLFCISIDCKISTQNTHLINKQHIRKTSIEFYLKVAISLFFIILLNVFFTPCFATEDSLQRIKLKELDFHLLISHLTQLYI